jgi:hypothetical protein
MSAAGAGEDENPIRNSAEVDGRCDAKTNTTVLRFEYRASAATDRPGRSRIIAAVMRITTYLRKGGTLEKAAAMANHASTRTMQFCDRRSDDVSLDEVARIGI